MNAKFAIALYDNEAESEEELSFRKNDILQINEIDFMGMEGWWLCKLIRENKTGLAPGNRLKLVNDENLILNKFKTKIQQNTALSTSTSSSSIVSSNSTSSSPSTIDSNLNSRLETLSIHPGKIVLPAKLKPDSESNSPKLKPNKTESRQECDNDEDDYDYDIPANNRPLSKLFLKNNEPKKDEENLCRKSISPTIDSGISTSSLISLNSDSLINSQLNQRISEYSSYDDSKQKLFEDKIYFLNNLIEHFHFDYLNLDVKKFLVLKEKIVEFEVNLKNFLFINLKNLKQENACFHPDLNTFNKFKHLYQDIKEFYYLNETLLIKLDKTFKWNLDLIRQDENFRLEFSNFLNNKLNIHFKSLLSQLKDLVNEKNLFDYHSDSLSYENKLNQDYSIINNNEYDNSAQNDNLYQSDADYCEIDELEEEKCLNKSNSEKLEKLVEKVSVERINAPLCMTLKRQDEKIRKEIKLSTNSASLNDKMLLKFYFKHIEDNFNDLKAIYDHLIEGLNTNLFDLTSLNELANKLALNGHKLVFICDTLERNLNNEVLKINLYESSNLMCDSLKIYMIRIKSINNLKSVKQVELVQDSLVSVFNSADKFKQIVLKHFYNSY